jgi:hypothetical protein
MFSPDDAFFVNAFFITIGCLLIVFRKSFARTAVAQQNLFFGLRLGERSVKLTEYGAALGGLGFIVISVLSLLGVGR